jgi:WD40 repeat protein
VLDLCFSADGSLLATATEEGALRVFDLAKQRLVFDQGVRTPGFVRFGRNRDLIHGNQWASGAGSFSLEGGRPRQAPPLHKNRLTSLELSPDRRFILTTSLDGTAALWDADTLRPWARLEGHEGAIVCGRFDHRGERVVTASLDGTARLWPVHPVEVARTHQVFESSADRDLIDALRGFSTKPEPPSSR